MKSIWSGVLVAFSMYSAVPVPQVKWEKQTMRWALSFLPLVGLLVGGAELLWYRFCTHFGAAGLLYGGGAALIPLVISGGIHLDGLCDTCDALCANVSRERKLEILADPHVGAFGPLWVAAFLLAETVCFAQIYETPAGLPIALFGFAIARAGGGRKVVTLPCAKSSGLAHLFAESSEKQAVRVMLIAQTLVYALCLLPFAGTVLPLFYVALHGLLDTLHDRLCHKAFGGITGDLAGFFISVAELLAVACAAFGGLLL